MAQTRDTVAQQRIIATEISGRLTITKKNNIKREISGEEMSSKAVNQKSAHCTGRLTSVSV